MNNRTTMTNLFEQIQEDMTVFDKHGTEVGTVNYVHFGDEGATTPSNTAVDNVASRMLKTFAEALKPSTELPEEVRERLYLSGFFRMDRGIIRNDAFVIPSQVERVEDDKVFLNEQKTNLLTG